MDGASPEAQNGAPIVQMKDGEANMYILAEGALGEATEGILLSNNDHVLTEISTEQQMTDPSMIAAELVVGNGEMIEEKLDQEKLEQDDIMEQESAIAAGPDNHSMYTSLPPFEYILHQSDVQKSDEQMVDESAAILSAKRMRSLTVRLEQLIDDVKKLVNTACSTKPTEDIKPQLGCDSTSLADNSFSITEHISHILGLSSESQPVATKLYVTEPEKINSEYKRCASVVDAVVQMISYNEPVDCVPNVSNIKQEGPGRPKGKKKKAKWTKEVTQKVVKFDVPDKIKKASNEELGKFIRKRYINRQPRVFRPFGYYPEYCLSQEEYEDIIASGSPYSCSQCQRQFVERRAFENHLNGKCLGINTEELQAQFKEDNGMFHCLYPGCSAIIQKSGSKWSVGPMYVHHQEYHLQGLELPFKCSQCDQSFFMQGLLGAHSRDVHKSELRECCNICGKSVSAFKLKIHMRRHRGEKPFKCKYCDYRAVEIGIVNKHIKLVHETHNLIKHICDICAKEFKNKDDLKKHLFVHSKPSFQCNICNKFMKHRNTYRRHMVVQHKVGHTCHLCGHVNFAISGLKLHQQKVHGINPM